MAVSLNRRFDVTKTQVMRQLRATGKAQTRKTYRNHGIQGDLFGTSFAEIGKLRRAIKMDQTLAEQLWATANYEARTLATMIADPTQMTGAKLKTWAADLEDRHLAGALSNLAAESAAARSLTKQWTSSHSEALACCGWHTLASLARADNDLDNAYFVEYLGKLESRIDSSANYAKYAMNNALINIGVRNPQLERRAVAAAKRIGKVDVDHGATSCKTPDAVAYIKKTVAYNQAKAARS